MPGPALYLLLFAASAIAQTQDVAHYRVTLRTPPGGIYAGEETEIEFRVEDVARPDPLTGFAPVVRASPSVTIDMPGMPGMPKFTQTAHAEGVPGDYGVHPTFAHGGDFRARITVHPPAGEAFTAEFPIAVRDALNASKRKPLPARFTLVLTTPKSKPRAGEPVELGFTIRDRDDARGFVRDFEMVHESLLHLVIVRRDLSQFGHEHPILGPDGGFRLQYTFPTGGEYHFFADVAPRGAGSQILGAKLDVGGPTETSFDIRKAAPDRTRETGGTTIELTAADVLPAGKTIPVTFTLRDSQTSQPVTDLEPYLGVTGHLMLVHEDAVTFVHSHPDEDGTLRFLSRFPKPGLYRGWLQFKRHGRIWTADFVFRAETVR